MKRKGTKAEPSASGPEPGKHCVPHAQRAAIFNLLICGLSTSTPSATWNSVSRAPPPPAALRERHHVHVTRAVLTPFSPISCVTMGHSAAEAAAPPSRAARACGGGRRRSPWTLSPVMMNVKPFLFCCRCQGTDGFWLELCTKGHLKTTEKRIWQCVLENIRCTFWTAQILTHLCIIVMHHVPYLSPLLQSRWQLWTLKSGLLHCPVTFTYHTFHTNHFLSTYCKATIHF